MSFVSSLSSLPYWGLSLAIKCDQSMSGTLKSPVTMKLGRVLLVAVFSVDPHLVVVS